MKYYFEVVKKSNTSNARKGILHLPHGDVETPAFMPDATHGFIRSLPNFLIPSKIIVMNTLHSFLDFGIENLQKDNGINNISKIPIPILSDSGGFQVYSLGIKNNCKITEEGIKFVLPNTQKRLLFTPELSMEIQNTMKTDIRVCLDYFTDPNGKKEDKEISIKLTAKWAQRSKDKWNGDSLIMGVIQGDTDLKLRAKSYESLHSLDLHGYGYGGWPIVNKHLDTKTLKNFCTLTSDDNKFRYAMGVGTPDDIRKCVNMGFDLFDTVLPTRNARHGYLYTNEGILRINQSNNKYDESPIDTKCNCPTCQNYSRSLLRYLFKSKDPIAYTLATVHNLWYYENLISSLRNQI